jgi:mono/diheme cytochrome c family protein
MRLSPWLGFAAFVVSAALYAPLPSAAQDAQDEQSQIAAFMTEGQPLYLKNCRTCHGTRGTAGVPLAGNYKLASPDWLANVIITGPGYMPEFGPVLSDEQIAAIATYVMNSWGNDFGLASLETVAALR